jgi:hypothetical protein
MVVTGIRALLGDETYWLLTSAVDKILNRPFTSFLRDFAACDPLIGTSQANL